jgi:phosphohistidine phosphatase
MARLLLLRHAKASSAGPGMRDFDRPLASRGLDGAARVAAWVAEAGMLPDIVLCSSAQRTRETLMPFLSHLDRAATIMLLPELYEPPGDYLAPIAKLGGVAGTLMVIGHNPATQATAVSLIGDADSTGLVQEVSGKYPTAGLAVVEFGFARWADIAEKSGRLAAFVTPRSLAKEGEDVSDLD